jgi:hypothetical protein
MAHRDISWPRSIRFGLGAKRTRHAAGARLSERYGSFNFVIFAESTTGPTKANEFWLPGGQPLRSLAMVSFYLFVYNAAFTRGAPNADGLDRLAGA